MPTQPAERNAAYATKFARASLRLYQHEGSFDITTANAQECADVSAAFRALGCVVVELDHSNRLNVTCVPKLDLGQDPRLANVLRNDASANRSESSRRSEG